MKTLNFLFFLIILSSCSTTRNNRQLVTIYGQAEDTKIGAIIVSNEDQKVYYLDDMSRWNNNVLFKEVRVTGILKKVKLRPRRSISGIPVAQTVGTIYKILNPEWELATMDSISN